jgi:hypothetical protein
MLDFLQTPGGCVGLLATTKNALAKRMQQQQLQQRQQSNPAIQEERAIRRANTLIEQNNPGKALAAISQSQPPQQPSEQLRESFQDLYPSNMDEAWSEEYTNNNSTNRKHSTPLTLSDIRKACQNFTASIGSDLYGWSPYVIRAMFPTSNDTVESLQQGKQDNQLAWERDVFINLINRFFQLGDASDYPPLSPCVKGALLGQRGLAFSKPSSSKIRPIGICTTFVKIGLKGLFRNHVTPFLQSSTSPFGNVQLGVGTSGGVEVLGKRIHTSMLTTAPSTENTNVQATNDPIVAITFDATNAFNRIHRKVVFRELSKHLPALVQPLLQIYGETLDITLASPFTEETFTVNSTEGLIQGDPLSSFLFCLAIQPLLQQTAKKFPMCDQGTTNNNNTDTIQDLCFYCDDGHAVAPLSTAMAILQYLAKEGQEYGLLLNPSKTQIWSPFSPITADDVRTKSTFSQEITGQIKLAQPEEGIILGGIPYGNPTWVKEQMLQNMHSMVHTTEPILKLYSAQYQNVLTRAIGPSLTNHFARGVPLHLLTEAANVQENQLLHLTEAILNQNIHTPQGEDPQPLPPQPLDDIFANMEEYKTWSQCTLPSSLGGNAMRTLYDTADAAYVGSWVLVSTTPAQQLSPCFMRVIQRPLAELPQDSPLAQHLQKFYEALSRLLFVGQESDLWDELYKSLLEDHMGSPAETDACTPFPPEASSIQRESQQVGTFSPISTSSSVPQFETAVEILDTLQKQSILSLCTTFSQLVPNSMNVQKYLSSMVYQVKHMRLINLYTSNNNTSGTPRPVHDDVVRLQSLRLPGSTAFLSVPPTQAVLRITNNATFRTMFSLLLGKPPHGELPLPRVCPECGAPSDVTGSHFAVCKKYKMDSQRHTQVIRDFRDALPSGSDPSKEVHGYTLATLNRRPIDLSYDMRNPDQLRAGLDFAILTRFQAPELSLVREGKVNGAMRLREESKINKLNGSINPATTKFIPCIVTSYGGIGPAMQQHLQHLAANYAHHNERRRIRLLTDFRNRLALAVQKAHASLFIERTQRAAQTIAVQSQKRNWNGGPLADITHRYSMVPPMSCQLTPLLVH